ncbi:hypothetical protein [Corynebacterium sp. AOP12-C2-36]|uniref:hypothetical protein n=1 Tax=Corynebacterium sp. AOP12-C2-36 TaxID=3457723 RepID=UPI004034B148
MSTSRDSTFDTGPGGPLARTTVAYSCDFGEVAWSPSDTPGELTDSSTVVSGGYIFGSDGMLVRLNRALSNAPDTVELSQDLSYTFTEKRRDLADVIAAMLLIRPSRGHLNDAGWAVLADAAGADVHTDDDLPEGAVR